MGRVLDRQLMLPRNKNIRVDSIRYDPNDFEWRNDLGKMERGAVTLVLRYSLPQSMIPTFDLQIQIKLNSENDFRLGYL